MKKSTKQILMIMLFLMLILSNFNIVHASGTVSCSSIEDSASDFVNKGEEQLKDIDDKQDDPDKKISKQITSEVVPVVRILSVGGILIIGCCMVILGIQWVMAKPSPEAQSKLKHRFVALAVAAGVMFGSYTIWSIIVRVMDSLGG